MDKDIKELQQAVALGWDQEKDQLPKVLASGKGDMARRIIEKAKELNMPIKEDKELVQILSAIEPEMEIPEEAIFAVAQVLAAIYRLNGKMEKIKQQGQAPS